MRCWRVLVLHGGSEPPMVQEAYKEACMVLDKACNENKLHQISSHRQLAKMRRATLKLVEEVKVRHFTSNCE